MDTTLRDGEQTPGVAFTPADKLALAKLLLCEVCVGRIEVASAGVSSGERDAVAGIVRFAKDAGLLGRVEVLGFCDEGSSADWVAELGATRLSLVAKGSERHCRLQLRCSPEQHARSLERSVAAARLRGLGVSGVYLEDWSRGVFESLGYVMELGVAKAS